MKESPASPLDPEDAVAAEREAAFLHPTDAGAQARLGRACLKSGILAEAIEALQRSLRIEPEDASVRADLGRAWLAAAEPEKAAFHLRRAVTPAGVPSHDLDPADALGARALLAIAESGGQGLPPVFVRTLFDQYADRFDAEMTGALAYRAPEALRDLCVHVIGAPAGQLDVLDLGCGTGLSGQAFRAFARTLVGVELSPRMAEKARARGIYDRVWVGDMISAMNDTPATFDLAIAVDAFGYVGDLAPVLRAVRGALRRQGWLAATVEEDRGEYFALGPARRFRHGANYLRRTAEATGFILRAMEPTVLRQDRGEPVAGLAIVLRV